MAILTTLQILLAVITVAALTILLAWGMWTRRDWARSAIIWLLALGVFYYAVTVLFGVSSQIFAGDNVMSLSEIFGVVMAGLSKVVGVGLVPWLIIYGLVRYASRFNESLAQKTFIDQSVRYLLIASALSSFFIVTLIFLFTLSESMTAITQIGLDNMLIGTIWRPQDGDFGLVPMVAGSILSTLGAIILGVPISIGTAILLAEIAPHAVRETLRPAIELLGGIPSVVYGLFGMVVLAPLIRQIPVANAMPPNNGFGLLDASIILAIMIMPTVTSVSEDAIRAVPRYYKEGALALGVTHWQAIWTVILPAARSGIVAAIILGIGRALGETMALIMVIGNSIALPEPLNNNPLTLVLSTARTLTGNVAVEINYAEGVHRSALFFTGVLLFLLILGVNTLARYLLRERLAS